MNPTEYFNLQAAQQNPMPANYSYYPQQTSTTDRSLMIMILGLTALIIVGGIIIMGMSKKR